jgi:hypothetical protein
MKIGILTLPLHVNYGGILQAYALQTVLERMGHEVKVITNPSIKIEISFRHKLFAYPKRFILKYLLRRKNTIIFYERCFNDSNEMVQKETNQFINKYIHCSSVSHLSDLKESHFDAIIVGSDQVWRKVYFTRSKAEPLTNAFLQFAKDWSIKRVAYAPSFGTEDWEYSEQDTRDCKALIGLFDALSVREQSGVRLCKQYFGVDAQLVLDPTMLLDATDYISLVEHSRAPSCKGNMHCYILDRTEEKKQLIEHIAKERGLSPFFVGADTFNLQIPKQERIQPPVELWLRAFYESEFIVTDSFHACVFSILFRKPFVVYGNKERGMARFHSLLSLFGLEDRLVAGVDDYSHLEEIDYDTVFKKLNKMRQVSSAFLQNTLNS